MNGTCWQSLGRFFVMMILTVFVLLDSSSIGQCQTPPPLPTVQFASSSSTVVQSAGTVQLEVTLSAESDQPVTVDYAVTGGTATPDEDYMVQGKTLTFAPRNPPNPGETSQKITVKIFSNGAVGPNTTVELTLSNPTGATLGTPIITTLTIINDYVPPPTVTFSPDPVNVYETESASLTATVSPSDANVGFVSADPTIATVSGTAPDLTVTGVTSGTTTIQAIYNGAPIAFVTVIVTQAGAIKIDPIATKSNLDPNGDENQIVNPAAIVIVAEIDRTAKNAAIIQITSPKEVPNDIEWTVKGNARDGVVAGEAKIFGASVGKTIQAHGVKEGFVLFEVRKKGNATVLETYEGLVMSLRELPFRVNLFFAKDGTGTNATEPLAQDHIKIANIYLRQIGLKLITDSDETTTNMFAPIIKYKAELIKRGFFKVTDLDPAYVNPKGITAVFDRLVDVRINARLNVVQINYVKDMNSQKGMCVNWPGSDGKGQRLEEWTYRGTVDTGLDSYKMEVSGPNLKNPFDLDKPQAGIWGILIENTGNGDPAQNKQLWGNTIAHELGHVFTLRHRNPEAKGIIQDVMPDKLPWFPGPNGPKALKFEPFFRHNAMCFTAPGFERTDFDQFQLRIMTKSDIWPK